MQGGFLAERFNRKHVGRREIIFNPETWDRPRSDRWSYVLTILGAFGLFVLLWTVGMLAWVVGLI